ncbi:MAG TPA: hypothetical protein PLW02_12320, partial [Verrucomicrobiota bacterium]|nr:hypothetical protein [Verrucomicrobiota bacterium]
AKPDPTVSPESEATFMFTIYADVTDSSGETRSANRVVIVGFTALSANIEAPQWVTVDVGTHLKVKTTTLDGEPQIAEGSFKVYKLKEPQQVYLAPFNNMQWWVQEVDPSEIEPDMSNPFNWQEGELVSEKGITTTKDGIAEMDFKLKVGCYRAVFETVDKYGKKVTAREQFTVVDTSADKFGVKIPNMLTAPRWSVEPGDEFIALWGTGYDSGIAYVQIEHRTKIIRRYWTPQDKTQHLIKIPITEEMRGGFTIYVTFVRENRIYFESRYVEVPWSNKELELSWEHFTSKLQPAQKETWSIVIKPKAGVAKGVAEKTAAELVATLYDESLDLFRKNVWINRFSIFRRDYPTISSYFCNRENYFQVALYGFKQPHISVDIRYRDFPPDIMENRMMYGRRGLSLGAGAELRKGATLLEAPAATMAAAPMAANRAVEMDSLGKADAAPASAAVKQESAKGISTRNEPEPTPQIDLSSVTARKNLNETAFFYPQLISDENGV